MQLQSKVRLVLLVFRGEETIGEYSITVPYGDTEAAYEVLRKLKPEFYGVLLGRFGVSAVSAHMPTDHPMHRAGAVHV